MNCHSKDTVVAFKFELKFRNTGLRVTAFSMLPFAAFKVWNVVDNVSSRRYFGQKTKRKKEQDLFESVGTCNMRPLSKTSPITGLHGCAHSW